MPPISTCRRGEEALRLIRSDTFDAVLLDLDLPGKSSFDALLEARRIKPLQPILIVSMLPEGKHAGRLFKTGTAGYIMKDCEADEFVRAVQHVAGYKRHISAQLAEQMILQQDDDGDRPSHAKLSDREYEIFELIVAGKPLTDIAIQLHISEKPSAPTAPAFWKKWA